MESRKKRNLEIEKRRKQKQRTFTAILAALIVVVVVVLVWAIWDVQNRRTIMTFEGERVATTDFRFIHLMQELNDIPPGEEANEMAVNTLLQTMVIFERAEENNIVVPEDEMAEIVAQAAGMREELHMEAPGLLNFISDRRIAELWSVTNLLEPLMDIYVPEFVPDEAEIAPLVEEHMDGVRNFLFDRNVKYIASHDWALFTELASLYMTGEATFDELIEQYCEFHEAGTPIEAVELWDFADRYEIGWAEISGVMELEEGEISDVLEAHGWFFMVQIYETVFDYEAAAEEEEFFRERFAGQRRGELFMEILEGWIEQANYTINQRALDRF